MAAHLPARRSSRACLQPLLPRRRPRPADRGWPPASAAFGTADLLRDSRVGLVDARLGPRCTAIALTGPATPAPMTTALSIDLPWCRHGIQAAPAARYGHGRVAPSPEGAHPRGMFGKPGPASGCTNVLSKVQTCPIYRSSSSSRARVTAWVRLAAPSLSRMWLTGRGQWRRQSQPMDAALQQVKRRPRGERRRDWSARSARRRWFRAGCW